MYAVFETGGKQYRVTKGAVIKVEKLETEVDGNIEFDKVLMLGEGDQSQIGAPFIAGGKVMAKVLEQGRHKKIKIIKFKRRKHHEKEIGHRQYFTKLEITDISA